MVNQGSITWRELAKRDFFLCYHNHTSCSFHAVVIQVIMEGLFLSAWQMTHSEDQSHPLLLVSIIHAATASTSSLSALWIPVVSVFPGHSRFCGFKELCLSVLKNWVQDPKCPGFSKSQKHSISDKAHEYFDFPTVLKKYIQE